MNANDISDEVVEEKEWKPADENNLTKEEKKILFTKQKDIFKLFYITFAFAMVMLFVKFCCFFLFGIIVSIDLNSIATALNVCIVLIGLSEGVRSIGATLTLSSGENSPVPAYKLKYLFGYLVSFIIITIVATSFEFISKFCQNEHIIDLEEIPDFASNKFQNALISNVISYLVARFGSKITESVDLSSLPFFKHK